VIAYAGATGRGVGLADASAYILPMARRKIGQPAREASGAG
jgi:hypothetical protein